MKLQFKRISEVHDDAVSRAWSIVCKARLCGIFIEWSESAKHVAGTSFLEMIEELSTEQAQLTSAFATQRLKHGLELDDARLEV